MPDAATPTGDAPKSIDEYKAKYLAASPDEQAEIKRSLNELLSSDKELRVGARSFPVLKVYERITGEACLAPVIDPAVLRDEYNEAKRTNDTDKTAAIESRINRLVEDPSLATFKTVDGIQFQGLAAYRFILGKAYPHVNDESPTLTELKVRYDSSKTRENKLAEDLKLIGGEGDRSWSDVFTRPELKARARISSILEKDEGVRAARAELASVSAGDESAVRVAAGALSKAENKAVNSAIAKLKDKIKGESKQCAEIERDLTQAIGKDPKVEFQLGAKRGDAAVKKGAEAYKFVTGKGYEPLAFISSVSAPEAPPPIFASPPIISGPDEASLRVSELEDRKALGWEENEAGELQLNPANTKKRGDEGLVKIKASVHSYDQEAKLEKAIPRSELKLSKPIPSTPQSIGGAIGWSIKFIITLLLSFFGRRASIPVPAPAPVPARARPQAQTNAVQAPDKLSLATHEPKSRIKMENGLEALSSRPDPAEDFEESPGRKR